MIAFMGDVRKQCGCCRCPQCGYEVTPCGTGGSYAYANGSVKKGLRPALSLREKLNNVEDADDRRREYRRRLNDDARIREWKNTNEPLVCHPRRKHRRIKRSSAKG